MPIFDYKCSCGLDKLNELAKFDEVILCDCGKEMKKQIGSPRLGNMDKYGSSK